MPLSPPRKANDEESNEKRLQESTSSKIISSEQQSLENLEAHVYIWIGGLDKLSPELWSYEEFLRDKLHRWVGGPPGGESDPNSGEENEYAEVDRRRAMNGKIVSSEQKGDEGVLPIFGHRVRDEFWSFEKGYTNLNHGAPHVLLRSLLTKSARFIHPSNHQEVTEHHPNLLSRLSETFKTRLRADLTLSSDGTT